MFKNRFHQNKPFHLKVEQKEINTLQALISFKIKRNIKQNMLRSQFIQTISLKPEKVKPKNMKFLKVLLNWKTNLNIKENIQKNRFRLIAKFRQGKVEARTIRSIKAPSN